DPVPNPLANLLAPVGTQDGAPLYEVAVSQFAQQLHSELPPTTLWGYNESYPGPTFEVNRGEAIKVRWVNNLTDSLGNPLDHILPYDNTIHGAGSQFSEARIVTHVHGAVTNEASDGFPEHWFTPNPLAAANGMGGPAGNQFVADYPNDQRSASLWYHDHAMGITRLNVYAGMAGFYLVRDAEEQSLNLPNGAYEMPLVLQDRKFQDDGQLFYPAGPGDMASPGVGDPLEGLTDFPGDASQTQHFFGDANLVNGAVWPFMEVEPRKYRFRLLNGANARFYDLQLDAGAQGLVDFHQIGTDSGLLATRVDRQQLLLAPADRADVIVDFSQFQPGDEILLRNLAPDGMYGLDGGASADPNTTGQVMKFKVIGSSGPDTSSLPLALSQFDALDASQAVATRKLALVESTDQYGRPKILLDGKSWTDAISEVVTLGTTEIWEFENFTRDAHPIHLHMDAFQLLDRTNRQTKVTTLPEAYEQGWEDTILVNPRETVRIVMQPNQFTGTFVWHCHVLEHEDYEMMRPFQIVAPLSADFDDDGDVDADDLAIWQTNFGASGGGDANQDGAVDGADFLIWQQELGRASVQAASGDASNSVPEPTTALQLTALVLSSLVAKRTTRQPPRAPLL
ncbi:MAG: multicopper oxidase domain-containing protein, partial [Planctomycetales bacterium]|nr:multicopper oxidase domain-containing protein [Planctomycetales bacterium]